MVIIIMLIVLHRRGDSGSGESVRYVARHAAGALHLHTVRQAGEPVDALGAESAHPASYQHAGTRGYRAAGSPALQQQRHRRRRDSGAL